MCVHHKAMVQHHVCAVYSTLTSPCNPEVHEYIHSNTSADQSAYGNVSACAYAYWSVSQQGHMYRAEMKMEGARQMLSV